MKIKDNFPLEKLKDFGFKTGEELIKENEAFLGAIYNYQHSYYFFYEPNLDPDDSIPYASDENEDFMAVIMVYPDTKRVGLELVPVGTYHIGEMDCPEVFRTFRKMCEAGIICDE